jgi:hypothetical protein
MRKLIFLALGVLESLAAVVLFVFAWQLPSAETVREGVGRVERVSRRTGDQVRRLRSQCAVLRERRPQLHDLARRLQTQLRSVGDELRSQQIDYETVRTVGESLGDAAVGLDGLGQTLDPKGFGDVAKGLKEAAAFLDEKLAPAAVRTADRLDQSCDALRVDADRLAKLLRKAPLDLGAVRDVHEGLGRFADGLDTMSAVVKPERLTTLKEGFQGLEESLTVGAGQVEKLADATYPVVTFDGLKPTIAERAFWPEGAKIAAGMRKAAKGATAAMQEVDALERDWPKLQASLAASRTVADKTRKALGTALEQQEQVEALLKDVPLQAARLAEELPLLGGDLAKVLRDTARLRDVAVLLREASAGVDAASARWPQLRQNLGRSADLLRVTQRQMKHALEHREEYEASLKQTAALSRTLAAALPLLTDELENELIDQEQSLGELGDGIDEVSETLPDAGRTAARVLQTSRLLLTLMGGVFAVHGVSLAFGVRLGGSGSRAAV